jgi:hypothetical protein
MRSRSVLAMIEAAAMLKLMPSPLLKVFCGTSTPGTVRAPDRFERVTVAAT